MFTDLKALTIPDGDVVKITDENGIVLWEFAEESKYTNQVPISIDTDKSIYNKTGYKDGYRLSSSGSEKEYDNSVVTGFIPAKSGAVIEIAGYPWYSTTAATNYICAYNGSFGFIYAGTSNKSYSTNKFVSSIVQKGDITEITLGDVSNMEYIRISYYGTNDGIRDVTGANLIVTVNEEIAA